MIHPDIITKAIWKINSNAQFVVRGNDFDTCEIEWVDNTAPILKADIKTQIPIVEKEIADAAAKKVTDKASADAKLKVLGLTDDEIEAFRN